MADTLQDEIPNDIRTAVISNLIQKVIDKEQEYASLSKEFRRRFTYIGTVTTIAYLLIGLSAVFVKPSWCETRQKLSPATPNLPECVGFKVNGEDRVFYRSNVPLFPIMTVSFFVWPFYPLLATIDIIKLTYNRTFMMAVYLALIIAVFAADLFIVVFMKSRAADWVCMLRIGFVVGMNPLLRRSIGRFLRVITQSSHIILLYVVNLCIFTLVGRALFYDVDEINPENKNVHYFLNFETFSKTIYTLFILSTKDNYPNIIFGIVNTRPLLLAYFFVFLIFCSVIMLSMMTGVFYTNFNDIYSESVDNLIDQKEEYRTLIKLCLRDKVLNFDKINRVLDSYLQHRMEKLDKQKTRKKKVKSEDGLSPPPNNEGWNPNETLKRVHTAEAEKPPEEDPMAVLANLFGGSKQETKRDQVINQVQEDLMEDDIRANKGNIMDAFVAMTHNQQEASTGGKQLIVMSRRKPNETLEVHEYLQQEKKENLLEQLSKAWYVAVLFTINDFVIALLPVVQLETFSSNEMPLNFYQLSEFLNVISLLSPIVTFKTNRTEIFKSRLLQFKLAVTLGLIVFSNILQFSPIPLGSNEIKENKNAYYIWCVLSLLKISSVHDLLKFSKEYLLILETFTQIVPLLGDLFVQLLLLMLFYCVLGVHMFGGLVHDKTKDAYKAMIGNEMDNEFEFLNFNDIPSGLLLLYVFAIMNDWSKVMTHCMVSLTADGEVFRARLFFLSFFMLGIMLVLSTTIGTIIAFINTYLSMLQEGGDLGIEAEDENKFDVVMNMFDARENAKRENAPVGTNRKKPTIGDQGSDSSSDDEETNVNKKIVTKITPIFPDD